MAIILLTEANLSFLKKELHKTCPGVRSCHLTEAIACALGFNTHSALLAEKNKHPSHVPAICDVSDQLLHQRIRTLCSDSSHCCGSLETLARHAGLPDKPWLNLKNASLESQNAWFRVCDIKCRPYIHISCKTKYWRLDWDCITYGGILEGKKVWDAALQTGTDDKNEVQFLWDEFVRVCAGHPVGRRQQTFQGSFFTGSLSFLSMEQAMELADIYFKQLYFLVQQFPPEPLSNGKDGAVTFHQKISKPGHGRSAPAQRS